MKVCTDACIFGAWTDVAGAERVLDIGTGTGLLSLMAAQRNPNAIVDGVEIDEDAYRQTQANFQNSPFHERLQVFHQAIQNFSPPNLYDCIICNPPFYQNDLKSPDHKTNKAHHAETLNLKELFEAVDRMLVQGGQFHLLLPPVQSQVSDQFALSSKFTLMQETHLTHKPGYPPIRRMTRWKKFGFGQKPSEPIASDDLYIYQINGKEYHPRFKAYLKAFYLSF